MALGLGRIGIIANPVAQSGAAAEVAHRFTKLLRAKAPDAYCDLLLTERPGHAIELAAKAHESYDTLIAIGGDGIVHESVNGLMDIPKDKRPALAVVPVGSGNDYALTLGMPSKIEEALDCILENCRKSFDVGCVNGEYFAETLSFGLDAAIALDTMERRKKSGKHGTRLYMESGFDQIMHHLVPDGYSAELEDALDGGGPLHISGESYIFAVQIGKTYGGHFKICPDADPSDGLLDICIAHAPLNALKAAFIFLMAKDGRHTGFKIFEFHKASSLVVEFDDEPKCQADGEKVEGRHFEIDCIPGALDVIVGKK